MSDFYSTGALGEIAGHLHALSVSLDTDRLFDRLEAQRNSRQALDQIRAEWAAAYEQLREIALDLEARNARLEAEIAQRDHQIANMKREVFDRDGKIHDLDDKVFYLEQDRRRLSAAANDYRARLAIISDEHDAAFI